VERRKEYLHGINVRNVLDTVFSRRLCLPWFPVRLDVIFGCRTTITKTKEVAEFRKAFLHTNQNTSHLHTSTDVPSVEYYSDILVVIFSCYHKFTLSIRSEQSEWHFWNSVVKEDSFYTSLRRVDETPPF